MGLKPGQTNNPGGRPLGSKNKNSLEIKETITGFLSEKWEDINRAFDEAKPAEQLKFYSTLLAYVLPRAQAIAIRDDREVRLPEWMTEERINLAPLTEEELRELERLQKKAGTSLGMTPVKYQ
jgi:hypothetical protein